MALTQWLVDVKRQRKHWVVTLPEPSLRQSAMERSASFSHPPECVCLSVVPGNWVWLSEGGRSAPRVSQSACQCRAVPSYVIMIIFCYFFMKRLSRLCLSIQFSPPPPTPPPFRPRPPSNLPVSQCLRSSRSTRNNCDDNASLNNYYSIQFNSIQKNDFNHPTGGNFVVVMAGSLKKKKKKKKKVS